MLWLCLHLGQLPLEVFNNTSDSKKPLATVESHKQQSFISHCNSLARQNHIEPGINQTLAKSLCPELVLKERNPQLEQQALQQLAICAYNFTPDIYFLGKEESQLYGNKLFLEISRSLRLFKGLRNFLENFLEEIKGFGFYFQFSLAKNPALASLASKHCCSIKPVKIEQLENTSVNILEIEQPLIEKLQATGIRKLDDLFRIDSTLIGKQFGKGLLDYLHELKGLKQKKLVPFQIPNEFSDEIHFISEVENSSLLILPIEKSLERLCRYLQLRQLSINAIKVELFSRSGNQPSNIHINFSKPEHRLEYMKELLNLRFENLTIDDAVIKIFLYARGLTERQMMEKDLFSHSLKINQHAEIDHQLLNNIYTRLGKESIFKLELKDDHRPEQAFSKQCLLEQPVKTLAKKLDFKIRPLWFLNEARKLNNKNGKVFYFGELKLLSDAERIETGWWDNQTVKRDYFIAQHPKGEFYWVYQDHLKQGQWFLHGIFS